MTTNVVETKISKCIARYLVCDPVYGSVTPSQPFVTNDWPEIDDVTSTEALQECTGSTNAVHPRDWD